jgi:hypothetical protein
MNALLTTLFGGLLAIAVQSLDRCRQSGAASSVTAADLVCRKTNNAKKDSCHRSVGIRNVPKAVQASSSLRKCTGAPFGYVWSGRWLFTAVVPKVAPVPEVIALLLVGAPP